MPDDASAIACAHHPGVRAYFVCRQCQAPVCSECCYRMPEGTYLCKECHAGPKAATTAPPAAAVVSAPSGLKLKKHEPPVHQPAPMRVSTSQAKPCAQHPHVFAVASCQLCGAGSCATCDFVFPGNLHLCPDCATTGQSGLSPRRKKYMIVSFILAGWSLVALVAVMVGAAVLFGDDPIAEMALGVVLIVVAYLPSIVGTALGMSAFRKGASNPLSVWIALILNSLVLAGFTLLVLVGNFMG